MRVGGWEKELKSKRGIKGGGKNTLVKGPGGCIIICNELITGRVWTWLKTTN